MARAVYARATGIAGPGAKAKSSKVAGGRTVGVASPKAQGGPASANPPAVEYIDPTDDATITYHYSLGEDSSGGG